MSKEENYKDVVEEVKSSMLSLNYDLLQAVMNSEGEKKEKINALVDVSDFGKKGDITPMVLEIVSGGWKNDSIEEIKAFWKTYFWEENLKLVCENCDVEITKEDEVCPQCGEEDFFVEPIVNYIVKLYLKERRGKNGRQSTS